MKKIYLIRHGLPDFPGGERMCLGITDLPLGPEGKQQAVLMAKKLPPVTRVYCSPLQRAVQTAQAIGSEIWIRSDLRERYAGDWDGLTFRQIRLRFPELYAARSEDRTLPLPNEEPKEEARSRFYSAVVQVAAEAPGDLVVVAHGGVIGLLLETLTGLWRKPDYCEVVPVLWDGEKLLWEEST